ncbi:thioredoxin, partial [Ostertagia ostertagi]
MRIVCVLAALVLGISASGDVLEYTDSNFDELIASHEVALVKFYAPWLVLIKYSKIKVRRSKPYQVTHYALPWRVDCTVEKATCDKFGVKGFPTLKIFRNGLEAQSYDGPREADGIVKYMRGQAGPSAKELKTVEEFK